MSPAGGEAPRAEASVGALAAALEREHHEIDAGVNAFLEARSQGDVDNAPLLRAMDALRRHIYLEEELMFPTLREGGLFAPLLGMLRQHGEIWDTMDSIDVQLSIDPSGDPGEESCRTLLEQLAYHNMMEEAVVYPKADTVLSTSAGPRLEEFLEAGEMPTGWRCKQAGKA